MGPTPRMLSVTFFRSLGSVTRFGPCLPLTVAATACFEGDEAEEKDGDNHKLQRAEPDSFDSFRYSTRDFVAASCELRRCCQNSCSSQALDSEMSRDRIKTPGRGCDDQRVDAISRGIPHTKHITSGHVDDETIDNLAKECISSC